MAAAEARAAWQRTANRCFVQEDAKRAPKLACCPSSSCAQQYDSSNDTATNGQVHPVPNFMPLNWNPLNSNLPPDTKWWLQLQPNFGHQKYFKCEHLNDVENELEEMKVENTTYCGLGESCPGDPMDIESKTKDYPFDSISPWMVSTTVMEHDSERKTEELKILTGNSPQILKHKMDISNCFSHDDELLDWKSVDELFPKKPDKDFSDLKTPCSGSNKCEPWWRVADKDELASLVAQRAQQNIENCDLPRPTQANRDPFSSLEGLDSNRIFSSSVSRNLHAGKYSSSATSGITDGKHGTSSEESYLLSGTEKLHSGAYSYSSTIKDLPQSTTLDRDPSRAQLLDALRHSQTRAREAEMAAQKACNEKEHTIKLLLRQASHLFAYKQWLHILQLETLSLQLRIKDHQFLTLYPVLQCMPVKRKLSKKRKKHTCNICKYAVLFAVGLGLAGAGLLLGWTLGWLLPAL